MSAPTPPQRKSSRDAKLEQDSTIPHNPQPCVTPAQLQRFSLTRADQPSPSTWLPTRPADVHEPSSPHRTRLAQPQPQKGTSSTGPASTTCVPLSTGLQHASLRLRARGFDARPGPDQLPRHGRRERHRRSPVTQARVWQQPGSRRRCKPRLQKCCSSVQRGL